MLKGPPMMVAELEEGTFLRGSRLAHSERCWQAKQELPGPKLTQINETSRPPSFSMFQHLKTSPPVERRSTGLHRSHLPAIVPQGRWVFECLQALSCYKQ